MARLHSALFALLGLALGLASSGQTRAASIVVRWQDNSDNEWGFRVERALGSGPFIRVALLPRDSTAYEDRSLIPGTLHRYRIQAYNDAGNSAYSNVVQLTTSPALASAAPVISGIDDQVLSVASGELRLPVFVGDDLTAADQLQLVGSSSNIELIPHRSIVINGRGAERSLVLRPVEGRIGSARISLAVFDGERVGYQQFTVTVDGAGIMTAPRSRVHARGDGQLINLSSRAIAGSGDDTLILGWTIAGGRGELLVRAVGPTLEQFGVSRPTSDPTLTIYGTGKAIASNTQWGGIPALADAFGRVGAFPLPSDSRDAALTIALDPGAYGAHVTGPTQDGVALVELYDLQATESTAGRLTNLSSRAMIRSGEGVLILGFAVSGDRALRVLLRAVGDSLGNYGVDRPLGAPWVQLYRQADTAETFRGWTPTPELLEAGFAVGAFPLTFRNEVAAELSLSAGNYTAVISGVGDRPGTALAELYELP